MRVWTFLLLASVVLVACDGSSGTSAVSTPPQGAGGGTNTTSAPLELLGATSTSARTIELRFSTGLDPLWAERPESYQLDSVPVLGARLGGDSRTVVLETHEQPPSRLTVRAPGVRGLAGQAPASGRDHATFTGTALTPVADLAAVTTLAEVTAQGFRVVDDPNATNSGPSSWDVQGGRVRQTANIYGGSGGAVPEPERPGTYLVHDRAFADGLIEAVMNNGDDDGMGLMLRYQDPDHFYRFEWDRQRRRRRLVKVVGGRATELAFDVERYEQNRDYLVRFAAEGDRLVAFVDGELILAARDAELLRGVAGVYCWGSNDLSVGGVRVQAMAAGTPVPLANRHRPYPDAPIATHDVTANDVGEDGALLWVRASEAAEVRFEVDLDGTFRSPIQVTAAALAGPASDFTVSSPVAGLAPNQSYHYRALLRAHGPRGPANPTRVGTFTTAPLANEMADVVFAVTADIHTAVPERMALLEAVRAKRPAFLLSLGDFPYADASPAATDLAGYLEKYRHVRSFSALRRSFLGVPLVATWDDHEVKNDWSGSTDPARVALGTGTWRNYFPYRATPGSQGANYRSVRWGAALELFVLDTRFHRDANSKADGPAKTMLGAAQKQWLLDGLSRSPATFKVIATSVPLRHGTTGNDHWKGFANERAQIFDFINRSGIQGVFFLSGDQHWAAVHHHPEGFVEVQACPLSAFLRTPPSPTPAGVTFTRETQSYGLVRIRAATGEALVELYDANDQLMHTERIR
ncbi:MAG: alkaline phosphatase D family protein [Planctomycetota bacterium]|jgi:alkaline phosphatase D